MKIRAFLLVETISRNHMESGGPLTSCEQKLSDPKNVSNPFVLFKLKVQEERVGVALGSHDPKACRPQHPSQQSNLPSLAFA